MAQNEEAPATAGDGSGACNMLGGSLQPGDNLVALQAQRLARAGVPRQIAAILAPVAFGGRGNG